MQQNAYQNPNTPVYYVNDPNFYQTTRVTFGEAIRRLFTHYADFYGRASRSEYWWAILFLYLVTYAAIFIPVINFIVWIGLLIPEISLKVRRLHDVGVSGFLLFLGLLPCIGNIVLLVLYCTRSEGDNKWGPCMRSN